MKCTMFVLHLQRATLEYSTSYVCAVAIDVDEVDGVRVVAVAVDGFKFDAIVGHGPPSDDPIRVGLWWTRFSSIVLGRPAPCAPAVVLVDANAKVGSEESFSVGPYRADGLILQKQLERSDF